MTTTTILIGRETKKGKRAEKQAERRRENMSANGRLLGPNEKIIKLYEDLKKYLSQRGDNK
jgi:hypothetical protein